MHEVFLRWALPPSPTIEFGSRCGMAEQGQGQAKAKFDRVPGLVSLTPRGFPDSASDPKTDGYETTENSAKSNPSTVCARVKRNFPPFRHDPAPSFGCAS